MHPNIVAKGLDNPRQLSRTHGGALVLGLAGRGGNTAKLGVIKHRHIRYVMRGFPSFADSDGTFAVGLNGASKRPGGAYYGLDLARKAPPGQRRDAFLLAKQPGGHVHKVFNVGRFERRHDPDGEGVESNPYSALALKGKVLVADAAGDYIGQYRHGKYRVWAVMPEYGPRIDAVPTVVARGGDGKVYVGELHSERPHKAKVWKFSRDGDRLRSWKGFTTVTGVARTKNGTLYVSELFGGPCGFDQIPNCFPGRVVKVAPNGHRSYYRVPFPAGIAARGHHVWVSAFSVSPGGGFGGNPDWSGQVWHFTT
ncbi:MAG TPA: ScyD/ScyE family protein [Nocardioidaceae bacterium]|nr:ScyD/ScyE family protein [Nocardioidaceae bacterium]